jgi:cytochrome c5
VEAVIKGKGAMPPRGGGADLSDFEIARAVAYLANASGGKFKEPEPPADAKTAAAPAPATAAAPAQRSGEQVVQAACGNCHLTGEGGAPKIGDKAAWAKRISAGVDRVVAAGIKGHGNMPARGGWADLTDAEMKQAVLYMFNAAGAKEIPPATAAAGGSGSGSVYFATGKAALDSQAQQAIAAIAAAAKGSEERVAITGYTDKTGNRAQNIELAKERAKVVREALVAAGVPRDRIDMKPPMEITGGADDKQARRVDVAMAGAAPTVAAAAPAAEASSAPPVDTAKGKALYDQACMACHATGAAGAPKLGDKAAWAGRIDSGLDALYAAAIKGKGTMPPKGGRADASDTDVKAAVDYMVSASK